MRKLILIGILLLMGTKVPAQDTTDTLQSWMSKFYRLANPVISETGKWAAVRKRYDIRQDTIIVVDTRKPNISAATLVLDGEVRFMKDEGILVSGSGKAEFLNLKSGMKKHYDNIVTAYPLSEMRRYGILTKDSVFSVYTMEGGRLNEIKGIQGFPVMDRHHSLYLCRKNGTQYEIHVISEHGIKKLSTSEHVVKEIELSPSGKQLFLMGKENETGKPQLTFIDTKDGSSSSLSLALSGKEDHFKVTEIQEGKAYWVALYTLQKPETGLVDIWYGNDDELGAKKNGSVKGRYWLWKPESGFREFPHDVYPVMASLNSERYFLAYHPTKGHNFLTYEPQFNDTSIYDIKQKTYRPLASLKGVIYGTPELICSNNGKLVVGSKDGQSWTVFDLENRSEHHIERKGLQNPVFSVDNQYIFFESNNDLWRYDLERKTLTQTRIAPDKALAIVNVTSYELSPYSHISVRSIDIKKKVLLEIKDNVENLTSYKIWKGNTIKEIISPTKNKIRNMVYDKRMKSFWTLEENYNMAPKLYSRKDENQKQLVYEGNTADQTASSPKQEIVHYTTADGLPLKGVFYYPVHYSTDKKYPMIVHIYQIQSDKSNKYETPSYNNSDGLDIRTLLERGYFVFLPDTAVGSDGAGLSALACVNKALDAVSRNPNIDMQRVGLVGHSFGGYETNFIATHSNRFAAYISGAGISDIIRSYFSYNYHYPGPHYWAYENGQFDMKISFFENKELYFKNNPIHHVEKVSGPILLWTGKQDQNVPWDQTTEFYIGLKRNKKPVIALFYPNGRHALGFDSPEKKDLYKRTLEWWDYFLKDKKGIQWIDKQMR